MEVEVRPRFPLFGGWKTHYIIGYNLPSYEYLYTLGGLMSMTLITLFLSFILAHTFTDIMQNHNTQLATGAGILNWANAIVNNNRVQATTYLAVPAEQNALICILFNREQHFGRHFSVYKLQ